MLLVSVFVSLFANGLCLFLNGGNSLLRFLEVDLPALNTSGNNSSTPLDNAIIPLLLERSPGLDSTEIVDKIAISDIVDKNASTTPVEPAAPVPENLKASPAPSLYDELVAQDRGTGTGTGVEDTTLLAAYLALFMFVMACVVTMYYHMGPEVVVQLIFYITVLSFMKISVKQVYQRNFYYPKSLTAFHLALSSVVAFSYLAYRSIRTQTPIPWPTRQELLLGILPISFTFGFAIAAENSALMLCSAAFSEVVDANGPLVSALFTWMMGMPFILLELAPIFLVISGSLISISGEVKLSFFGTVLLLAGVVSRCFKVVMEQRLMTGETKQKFDPVSLMAWVCLFACLQLMVYAGVLEGSQAVQTLLAKDGDFGTIAAIGASTVLACMLNFTSLCVVRSIGAVGMQLLSQMKSVLIVIGGIALLHEDFSTTEAVGFGFVMGGVFWHSKLRMKGPTTHHGHFNVSLTKEQSAELEKTDMLRKNSI